MYASFSINRMSMMDDWKRWMNNGLLLVLNIMTHTHWMKWRQKAGVECDCIKTPISLDYAKHFLHQLEKRFSRICYPDPGETCRQYSQCLQFKTLHPISDLCFTSCMQKSKGNLRLCINLNRKSIQKSSASSMLWTRKATLADPLFC